MKSGEIDEDVPGSANVAFLLDVISQNTDIDFCDRRLAASSHVSALGQ